MEGVDDVRRRDFAAQMGEMVGAQKICVGRPADRLREQRGLVAELLAGVKFINPDPK